MDALDEMDITPLRVTEVQSEEDEDLVSDLLDEDIGGDHPLHIAMFTFMLAVAYTLMIYGILTLFNYVHALFK
jgi:uncharacterized phage infection (PIP) family protein YhgE